MSNALGDPLAISLVAQKMFNHQLLFELITLGLITKEDGSRVTATTASNLRGLSVTTSMEPFTAKLADGFERISADLLGLPPITGS
jgi:hypothetical protein